MYQEMKSEDLKQKQIASPADVPRKDKWWNDKSESGKKESL